MSLSRRNLRPIRTAASREVQRVFSVDANLFHDEIGELLDDLAANERFMAREKFAEGRVIFDASQLGTDSSREIFLMAVGISQIPIRRDACAGGPCIFGG